MNMRFYTLCLLVFALCSACAAQKVAVQEPATFASFEDFKLGPEGGVDLVWSTKSIQDAQTLKTVLQKYDSLILGQIWVVVDRVSFRAIDDKQVLEISRYMAKQIQARLGHEFKIVATPDENTLRLNLALTNLETLDPILAAASRLLPSSTGTATVSTIVAGEAAKVGSITVELLVSDAKTNQPLLAAIDQDFDNKQIAAMLASPDNTQEAVSMWADRLWITLSYWNWIKKQSPAP